MGSRSKFGEGSSSGGGRSAADPQPSTSRQQEPEASTSQRAEGNSGFAETQRAICDIFVSGYKPLPAALTDPPGGVFPGKYKLVACELATTGRRLVDEICIIAAYTRPEKSYLQHIMPHGNLYPGARRRHKIQVYTGGPYRMMRSTVTHKIIKTKLEYGALLEFMEWLKSLKQDHEKILLLYHDPQRLTPIKIVQAILRFNLMDKFKSIVAGFSDSYALCFDKCGATFKSVSIDSLAKVLLDEGSQGTGTTMQRAMAIYNVLEQLASQGGELMYDVAIGGYDASFIEAEMIHLACVFGRTVHAEIEAFTNLKDLVARQDTFRLAIAPLQNCSKAERRRLTLLRAVLAEAGLVFEQVKDAWFEGRRAGIVNLLAPLEHVIRAEEIERIVSIFVSHFNPNEDEIVENVEREEENDLYWSSDADDNSDDEIDLAESPDDLERFAEDFFDF